MSIEHLDPKTRLRVAILSIVAGLLILGMKYWAYAVSGSTALLSDAIESVVNVVAAVFALGAVIFADKPADREHPYGHGKIEHFSAAFEGGLISLAAAIVGWEALHALWHGPTLQNVRLGLTINFIAGLGNGLLGLYLIAMGRKQRSKAIEADGHHVLSDFWTTLGIAVGLVAVKLTGLHWLDPLMALAVAGLLAWTGFKLVHSSSQALLDMEDPELLKRLLEVFNGERPAGIIAVHELRTLRSGRYSHVDIHLVVPEFYTTLEAHELIEGFSKQVIKATELEGEFQTHVDPCQRAWCENCQLEPCPVRQSSFRERAPITLDSATGAGTI